MTNREKETRPPGRTTVKTEPRARARRQYVVPTLIDYGTVAKLTQGGAGSSTDAGGMMVMSCL